MTDLRTENQEFKTKWQESDKEIKRLNTNLQKAQTLLFEYIAHCNKENSHYSNDKEEYTKKCNNVTI